MKEKIIYILKLFVIILIVLFCLVFVVVARSKILDYKLDENRIVSIYETEKEEYDLVCSLLDNVLIEGKYIDTKKIPDDKIEYMIYNNNGNVIFSYSLKEEYSSNKELYAKITLTNDYNIVNEEYGSKLSNFEDYKKVYIEKSKLYALSTPILLSICLIAIVIFVFMTFMTLKKFLRYLKY